MQTLEKAAIDAGIKGDWEQAIIINKKILSESSKNIDALNRLSFAYYQTQNLKMAKKTIEQALRLDKFDPIANRNLNLVNSFSNGKFPKQKPVENVDFIEEPGTRKIISLVDLCNKSELQKIRSGTKLSYKIRRRKICIQLENKYLGKLTDDLNRKLMRLLEKGDSCELFFKSCDQKKLFIFIKLNSKTLALD